MPATNQQEQAKAIGVNGNGYPSDLIAVITQHLIKGHTHQQIFEWLTTHDKEKPECPGLSEEVAQACLVAATKELARDHNSKTYKRGLAESAYLMLYQSMVSCGDFNGARSAMDRFVELNKLKEVDTKKAPKKIRPSSPGGPKAFML